MESPYKDQYKFPVHQSAAHHGVGGGCHSTLLFPATSEVCLLTSSFDGIIHFSFKIMLCIRHMRLL